ncbi:hypothetical protein QAD02_020307 [Eretmocerus hayati]|uniref:Uncharacterized protein n=1 Tax=Eretmocerus hayati TaxID=131215 RepID=A0ACC2PM69_9HYME|nr:hypothetical protein QAD02_020307 [Eretmocerus hayati]
MRGSDSSTTAKVIQSSAAASSQTSSGQTKNDDCLAFYKKLPLHRATLATSIDQANDKKKSRKSKLKKSKKIAAPKMDNAAHRKAAQGDKLVQTFSEAQQVFQATEESLDKTSSNKDNSFIHGLIKQEFKLVKEDQRDRCVNEILDTIGLINICTPEDSNPDIWLADIAWTFKNRDGSETSWCLFLDRVRLRIHRFGLYAKNTLLSVILELQIDVNIFLAFD